MALAAKSSTCSSFTDSTPRWNWKYHVFLSFRGEDTRFGFADHLYTTLQKKSIVTFRDREGLERGEFISQELLNAIKESLFAVVILSETYASSTWCLEELRNILECKHKLGQEVLPVFYGVDPSDVRHQRGSFAKAFETHEEKFREDKEKVRNWRAALTEVANISGWNSNNCYETDLVEGIAEAVWTKLHPKLPSTFDGLVGIDSKVKEMKKLLKMGLEDVCFVGIWGMGGIGKTTLARAVYEGIQNEFQISCFLADVRTVSKEQGLVHLQKKLLSSLNLGNIEINDQREGRMKIRHFLCNRKVLLVLDDVSDKSQLKYLAENQEWFCPGSRVIITTRDRHLLTPQVIKKYDMKLLNRNESLQLFYQNAFPKDQPEAGYLELSKDMLEYCGGLPLALEVLGSFLCGRSASQWQEALNRMKQNPGNEILEILQLGYCGLTDEERSLFLDFACFFSRLEEKEMNKVLKDCGPYSTLGLNILAEKSLLCYERPYYIMHDLLRQLGRNIVLEESPNDASKRSRLWSLEDIDRVLKKNEGTEKIQGISLFLPQSYQVDWHEDCFSKMSSLRLLLITGDVHLSHGLKSLPGALKVLMWEGYPLNTLPNIVQFDELVYLELVSSKLRQLWNRTQFLGKLKYIDLSHSQDLTRTPDFGGIPNLETLILEDCVSLVEVHASLGQHGKLVEVDFSGCKNLTSLPSKLSMNSLKKFTLSGCLKLEKLPEFGENMKSLSILNLEDTAVENLHPSLGFLTRLSVLNLTGCKNLVCLPSTTCNLKSLRILNISLCTNLRRLPENLNENVNLEELCAMGTSIREVPSYIVDLKNLQVLDFSGCKGIEVISSSFSLPLHLPPSFSGLTLLRDLDLSFCDLVDESIPDDFSCLSSLRALMLMGNYFVYLPVGCISHLLKLDYLYLSECSRLRSLPQLPPNLSLVETINCDSLEPLLDPQQLLHLFARRDFQNSNTRFYGGDFFWLTTGNEIPSWFHNQDFHFVGDFHFDSAISITFHIPDYYLHPSEWSGIAVCLVLEDLSPSPGCRWRPSVEWCFQSLQDESKFDVKACLVQECYDRPLLFVAFYPFNNFNCWRHLRGDPTNWLKLTIFTRRCSQAGVPLRLTEKGGKLGIKECGWRLLCKGDFEMWLKTVGECNASPSISTSSDIEIPFSGLNNPRPRVTQVSSDTQCQDKFGGQHPSQTIFNAEARRSFLTSFSKIYTWPLFIVNLLLFALVGVYIFSML